jgi:hypothetical protein
MKPNYPIALGAGLISAVVFASATTGPFPVRMLLLALLAMPIALAGFSYNAKTAIAAALIGTGAVALVFKPAGILLFTLAVFPAAGLVYLALLNREDEDGTKYWYPVGRLLLAAEIVAAALVAIALLTLVGDMSELRTAVKAAVESVIAQGMSGLPTGAKLSDEQLTQTADVMLILLPAAGASMVLGSLLLALWLGARVARASGTLVRPWPDIAAFSFPGGAPLLLVISFLATMVLTDKAQLVALAFAGTFYTGYVLLGLAIAHYTTRGLAFRGALLAALYMVVLLVNSGASLVLAIVGLADSLYPFRRRNGGPPAPEA